jgi:ubiquinone/menaquinone biosynthesis C-methylase UbiE
MNWWKSYFDDAYFDLHDSLFTERTSRREVSAMRELHGLQVGARILDAPCGWGRHTELFAEAACDAFGADLSPALLRRAAPHPGSHTRPRYAAADLRFLPFRDASFDAVCNVFTSLGLFLDDAEDIAALREARRLLRPDGAFLLESMHRDDVIAAYAEKDEWTLTDGTRVRVRRRFDPVTGISHERLRWQRGDEEGRKAHALRLRTATEIDALLQAAGFSDIQYYGSWSGAPLRHDSTHVIAVARNLPGT